MRHFLRVKENHRNSSRFTQGEVYKDKSKFNYPDCAVVVNDQGGTSEINLVAEGYWLEIPETFNVDTAASLISEWSANLDLDLVSFYEFAKSRFDDHLKQVGRLTKDSNYGGKFSNFTNRAFGEPFSLAQKRSTTFIPNQPEKEKPKMIQIEDVHTVTINGTDASSINDQGVLHFVMQEEQNLVALDAIKTPSVAIDNLRKKHKANIKRLLAILDDRHLEQLKKDNPGCGVTLITIGGDNMAESVAKILAATREEKYQPAGSAVKSETEEPEDTTG